MKLRVAAYYRTPAHYLATGASIPAKEKLYVVSTPGFLRRLFGSTEKLEVYERYVPGAWHTREGWSVPDAFGDKLFALRDDWEHDSARHLSNTHNQD